MGDPSPEEPKVILIAEDDAPVRGMIASMLMGDSYSLLMARDGAEALELSRAHHGPIHLLLTDMDMPEISGRELAGLLSIERPAIRVLLISGNEGHACQTRLPFLAKPFLRDALESKIKETLRRPLAGSAEV